jgi:hypothetical protein
MKIAPQDLQALREAVVPLDTAYRRDWYWLNRAQLSRKSIDMRYRWDLLHLSKHSIIPLYSYLDDTHIDTALRAIVPPLRTR